MAILSATTWGLVFGRHEPSFEPNKGSLTHRQREGVRCQVSAMKEIRSLPVKTTNLKNVWRTLL